MKGQEPKKIRYLEESVRLLGKLAAQDEYTFLSYFVKTMGDLALTFMGDEDDDEDRFEYTKEEALYKEYLPLLLKLVNRTD